MADYGYIGRNPADSNTIIGRQIFTATSGQTSFTVTGGYDVGFIQVYLNGIKLLEGQDYQANDKRTVLLDDPAEENDKLEVVAFKAFNVSLPESTGTLSVTGNLNVAGSLGVVGFLTAAATALENITITGLSTFGSNNGIGTVTMGKESAAIFCDGNQRVVGVLTVGPPDTGVTVDGGNSRVGVGTTIPGAALEIVNTQARNSFRVADQLNPDYSPFVIDQSGNTGIGTLSPQTNLHVRSLNNKILARFRNEDGDEDRCEIEFQDEQTSGNFKVKVGSQGDNLTGMCGFQSSIILGDNLNSERVHIRAKVDVSSTGLADDGLGVTGFGTFSDYNANQELRDTRIRVAGGICFRPMTEDHRNGETNMPWIGYGRDGTDEGGNNLELIAHSADGAINFYTGNSVNGVPGSNLNTQRVVIGPDGQLGIGVTLGDSDAPTTNESVVLGLGVSMCMDIGSGDDHPVIINAGPQSKTSIQSQTISLGCTVTSSTTAAGNIRIGYSLAPPTNSADSVLIGRRISCNSNGGTENVYIGSQINENVTTDATNGNVVIGHDLELTDSLDRCVLIGGITDLATQAPTISDGAGGTPAAITPTTGGLHLAYNGKHHLYSDYAGSSVIYHNGDPAIETHDSISAGIAVTVRGDLGCTGSFYAGGSFSADSLVTEQVTGENDNLTLASQDNNERIVLSQTGTDIDFIVSGSTSMQVRASGVLRSGINGFTIQDSAGNSDFSLNSNGAITCVRTYSQGTPTPRRDVFVSSAGLFGYNNSTIRSKKNVVGLTTESVSWIYDLRPVQFNYRKEDEDGNWTEEAYDEIEYGLIAEEVEDVNTELCSYDVDDEGNKDLVTVTYSKLYAPLIKAVQDCNERIKSLEAEVASLKSQLNT